MGMDVGRIERLREREQDARIRAAQARNGWAANLFNNMAEELAQEIRASTAPQAR